MAGTGDNKRPRHSGDLGHVSDDLGRRIFAAQFRADSEAYDRDFERRRKAGEFDKPATRVEAAEAGGKEGRKR